MAESNDVLVSGFLRRAVEGDTSSFDADTATANISNSYAAPVGFGETFGAGVTSAGEGMIGDLEYLKALGNSLIGDEEASAANVKAARIKGEIASNATYGMETFDQFVKNPTFNGFFDQVVLGVGQITPSVVTSMATGFTGVLAGAAGKAAMGVTAKAAAKKLTEQALAKKAAGEVLDKAEQEYLDATYALYSKEAIKYGGIAGMVAGEYPFMAGGSFGEFDEAGVDLSADRALQSLLIGGAQTAVSIGGEVFVLGKLAALAKSKPGTNPKLLQALAGGAAKGFGTSGATEAATEVIQEGMGIAQRMSVDDSYTAEQAQLRLGQAAFIGFFGGGVPGAIGGTAAGGYNFATQGGADAIFKKAQGMLDDRADASARTELDKEELGIPDDGIDPAAESNEDIAAQVAATVDSDYGKQATWVPISQGLSSNGAPNEVTEQTIEGTKIYAAFIPNRGTILSGDRALVEEVVKSGADDASLSIALDYSDTRKGDLVVRVKNNNGDVIHEQQVDEAGQEAALISAQKVAGTKGVVDVVSGQQALAERKARRDDSISTRNMLSNQDMDETGDVNEQMDETGDLNEQEGSFSTEAQERELNEGFNELEAQEDQVIKDFAKSDPKFRSDPAAFENIWANILTRVPEEERAAIAALEPLASDSFARGFLDMLTNDPGYYRVVEDGDRLAIMRSPQETDVVLASRDQGGDVQREAQVTNTLVKKLINPRESETANRGYVFLDEVGMPKYSEEEARKILASNPRAKTRKTAINEAVFEILGPDGSKNDIQIGEIIAAGRKLNAATETALVGEGLTDTQSIKAGLLRGLSTLLEKGYTVSFRGEPLTALNTEAQSGVEAEVSSPMETARQVQQIRSSEQYRNASPEQRARIETQLEMLIKQSTSQTRDGTGSPALGVVDRLYNLRGADAKMFKELSIFKLGTGKAQANFTLEQILTATDTIPVESQQADQRASERPDRAMKQAERRLEQWVFQEVQNRLERNPITGGFAGPETTVDPKRKAREESQARAEAKRLGKLDEFYAEALQDEIDQDIAFEPKDITETAETEGVSVAPVVESDQILSAAKIAAQRVFEWSEGNRRAGIDVEPQQFQAKFEEFLAEEQAIENEATGFNDQIAQKPASKGFIGPRTGGTPLTSARGRGMVSGSTELVNEIEESQASAAKDAGISRADKQVDPDPRRAEQAKERQAELDAIQLRRQQRQSGLSEEQFNQRNEQLGASNTPAAPDVHPGRVAMESAPEAGGQTEVQANASGDVKNRLLKARDVAFRTEVIKFLDNNNVSPDNVKRYTKIVGEFGDATRMVLEKALKIFRNQIKKPITVYTRSAWLEETQRIAKAQFELGNISLAQMYDELAQSLEQLPAGRGSVITHADRYVIIINDTFSDGDTAGADFQMAAVLGHELGHIVFDQEIKRLVDGGGPQMDMLQKAFEQTLLSGAYYGGPDREIIQYEGKHGFEEWYADQIASFLYDESKKASNGVNAYFKKIANLMRQFFDEINKLLDGRLTKNEDFRKYVKDFLKASNDNLDFYSNLTGDSHLDAIDKLAIRNWNGALSDHVPPKVTQAVARMTKRMLSSGTYGFLKKYTTASDNWLRGLGPAGVELARFFQAKSQSTEKAGFHHDKQRVENTYMQKLATALGVNPNNSSEWDTPALNDILLEAEDETIDTADLQDPRSKAVRAVFAEFHEQYLSAKGQGGKPFFEVRRRKNYAPRLMDFSVLTDDSEAGALARENLAQLILQYAPDMVATHRSKRKQTYQPDDMDVARDIVREIVADPAESSEVMRDQRAKRKQQYLDEATTDEQRTIIELMLPDDDQETDGGSISPGMKNSLARTLNMIPTKELRKINVIAPPVVAFTQYFHHATRRVEFEKRGGEQRIFELIAALPKEHQAYAMQAVRGQLGRVGIGMKSWVRQLNSFDAVMTSTTTLLFTAMVSFTDTAGPIIRSKDFAGMGRAFKEIGKTLSSDENQKLSRAIGVASAEAAANIFMAAGELDYANSTSRKILDKFFRYTGLQLYTRFSREFAAGMGREFLLDIADRAKTETTDRWLAELDITRQQIKTWDSGNGDFTSPEGKAVARAIAKFVDESIVRPNAAERPVWASHPMAMIVWRLKSYFYSFGKIIVGGMAREMKNRYREDGDFRGGGMLLALAMGTLLPLAALGMELKELTRYMLQALFPGVEATGRVFRSDHMAAPEYLATLFEKTGALGPWAIPVSIISSAQWGDNPIVSQVPLIDMFDATLLEGNWTRPIPILNNVD